MKRQRIKLRIVSLSARSTGRKTYKFDDLFVFTGGKPKPPPVRTAS